LVERLKKAVKRINKFIPVDAQTEAIKEIQRIASRDTLLPKLMSEEVRVEI
jgi:type I restriction enzyme R subunit